MQEIDLIKRIKDGETGSFRELVLKFQNSVINTCYSFVFNKEDAEDIAQEVFIEIYKSIRKSNSFAAHHPP